MITMFTTCKPFTEDHVSDRQRRAIESWCLFTSSIILFGGDEGVKHVADRYGCKYVPDVECNEQGRPFISSMFKEAQKRWPGPHFCFANSDNMLAGLPEAFERVSRKFPSFLMVGKRFDWMPRKGNTSDLEEVVDGWQDKALRGRMHNEWAIEYFGFTRGMFRNLPRFHPGWPGWDNWTILHCLKLDVPIIDVTEVVRCVHQQHRSSWRSDLDNPHYKWNMDLASDLVVPGAHGGVEAAPWILRKDGRIVRR